MGNVWNSYNFVKPLHLCTNVVLVMFVFCFVFLCTLNFCFSVLHIMFSHITMGRQDGKKEHLITFIFQTRPRWWWLSSFFPVLYLCLLVSVNHHVCLNNSELDSLASSPKPGRSQKKTEDTEATDIFVLILSGGEAWTHS